MKRRDITAIYKKTCVIELTKNYSNGSNKYIVMRCIKWYTHMMCENTYLFLNCYFYLIYYLDLNLNVLV